MSQNITILGSTGSIGCSALHVIRQHPERFNIFALSAYTNVEALLEQCQEFQPRYAVIADADHYTALKAGLSGLATEALGGEQALIEVAGMTESETVIVAIVGIAALRPTLSAVQKRRRILLANKEILVSAGPLFMAAIAKEQAQLLPIDSEHNALFQCLDQQAQRQDCAGVSQVVLTASGGPFLNTPMSELHNKTAAQACAHPNWEMGQKISVDSATMMNKGFEVIEACCLFGFAPEQVKVVVHPQSIVHAIVQWKDGSCLAQISQPDMCIPIAHALAWPERIDSTVPSIDLAEAGQLVFQPLDHEKFPCLDFAYDALHQGSDSLIALNAANEIAVFDFLAHKIRYTDIAPLIEQTVAHIQNEASAFNTGTDLDAVFFVHEQATQHAKLLSQKMSQV